MKAPPPENDRPFSLRLLLRYGKWFGAGFVPDNTLQVIYTNGLYAGVRGPGQFRYNRFNETLGPQISIVPQRRSLVYPDMLANDGLPMTVRLNVVFSYDPRRAPKFAMILVRTTPEIRLNLVTVFAERATRVSISQRNSMELPQAAVLETIEGEISRALRSDLETLGFEFPGSRPVMVLQIQPPATLTTRHEQNAQRRAQILAGEEFHPSDYRRALITEFIENLARTGAGESIINFNELVDAYVAEYKTDPGPRVINQPSTPREEPPTPPPPSGPPSAPPPAPPPKSDKPRSRLS
jgi:hypothetical protein